MRLMQWQSFQQRLRQHAFDTFESLLLQYSLSPQLGHFQSWVKNVPEKNGIKPNENFARELMQLFTIGVNELWDDGTPKLNNQQQFVPTYGAAGYRDACQNPHGLCLSDAAWTDSQLLEQPTLLHWRHDSVR